MSANAANYNPNSISNLNSISNPKGNIISLSFSPFSEMREKTLTGMREKRTSGSAFWIVTFVNLFDKPAFAG